MHQLSFYTLKKGRKTLLIIPESPEQKPSFQPGEQGVLHYQASGTFGSLQGIEIKLDIGICQWIGIRLNEKEALHFLLAGNRGRLSFSLKGSFLTRMRNSGLQLLAGAQGTFAGHAPGTHFLADPVQGKDFELFNFWFTSTDSMEQDKPSGIYPYLLKRISYIQGANSHSAVFTASVATQREIKDCKTECRKTIPDKNFLNHRVPLMLKEGLSDLNEIPDNKHLFEQGNELEWMVSILAESMILAMEESWAVKTMAYSNHLSVNTLNRLFVKFIGMPVARFLIFVRIEKAKQLLQETNLPIQEISLSVGYPNPSHFSKLFRRKTGYSPGDLRKSKHQA